MGTAHLLTLLLVSCLTATLLGEANVINKRTTEGEEELIHGIEKVNIVVYLNHIMQIRLPKITLKEGQNLKF